ncbi:MAG: hypothetical protein UR28_C0015G0033 [Candidatus Peregrinibacteria bacterium GW2011_GWF2_33_10]|nr:MAG: hypothetical protein UR28_C0015G0033 [Candidatus Peregrinibacteria bacterium GW2011_GWF2_33_10]OGJ44970.1 MAG: hypothetical protein A2263_02810 [Candidatus Peregrinibacteria bacterium RIFOXYA2_FULL_33_21]OGJ46368.1 MAG: hypothetical protein A2272_01125 [Candidatus Peregrinibacteria bacterium RIFOXYA12_FULL_33_12]OGJ50713.1 MAG: hypothetical protein A2307_03625 [Candidatus Peregrinibacteria bacterium RIFOXYB2_FULL_33_20]
MREQTSDFERLKKFGILIDYLGLDCILATEESEISEESILVIQNTRTILVTLLESLFQIKIPQDLKIKINGKELDLSNPDEKNLNEYGLNNHFSAQIPIIILGINGTNLELESKYYQLKIASLILGVRPWNLKTNKRPFYHKGFRTNPDLN